MSGNNLSSEAIQVVAVEVIDVDHDDDGGGKPSPICLDGTGGGCKVHKGYIQPPLAFLSLSVPRIKNPANLVGRGFTNVLRRQMPRSSIPR